MTRLVLACSFVVGAGLLWSAVSLSAVVATVNGKNLTDADLKRALAGMNEGQRSRILGDKISKRQAVDQLVDRELILAEARKAKVSNDAKYREALETYKQQLLGNLMLEKQIGKKLSDKAVEKFYRQNKRKFSTDQVHVQHILVSSKKRAQELTAQAKKGSDFQKLAVKHSKDPSAKNNRGDVGFIGWGQMVPEFETAAFGGEVGQVVGPVRTNYGWHIIKIIEKKRGQALEFAEVENQARNALRAQLVRDYITQLRSRAKITVK